MRLFARAGTWRWALALVLGCGRVAFDPRVAPNGDGGIADGRDAGPLVCGGWGPVELVPELSSLSTDFGPSLTSDGGRIYLHSDRMGSRDIYISELSGGVFTTPMPVMDINDAGFDDGSATTTADDREIFFDSHRVNDMPCIYWASRATAQAPWGNVTRLASICTTDSAAGPHISADGMRLYYTRLLGGNVEGTIMISTRTSRQDPFDIGVPLGGPWLGGPDIGYPSLSADELEIYFESGNPLELYTARRDAIGDPFGTPVIATDLNSANLEVDADLSADGRTLYMASDRPGGLSGSSGYDIWRTTRTCN